jgi:Zn-dependent protease
VEPSHLIQSIALYALPVLFAITVHEAAHGYAARHFGDNTAWKLGRITLNPIKHIDLFGTILLPLILIALSSPFVFGAAKPVPVRFGNLRNPKRDMVWVALAGPAANLAMALAWGFFLLGIKALGVSETFLLKMCEGGVAVNVMLFAFNLFPLPPLDGGRILVGLLPYRQAHWLSRVEPFGIFIVMGLALMTPVLSYLWMQPMMALAYGAINLVLAPFSLLLH